MEKTAVEWLVDMLDGERHLTENEIQKVIEQAKLMEKQQIDDSWYKGYDVGFVCGLNAND